MSAPRIINPATAGGGVPVGGSGAAGYVAKWTAATTLGGSTTTGATASLYVDATGQVGIGTASPQEKLQVYGNLKVGVLASGSYISLADESTSARSSGIFRLPGYYVTGVGGSSGIMFTTGTGGLGSQTEQMRIDATGNVGIGTASPTGRLHVVGGTAAAATNGAPVTIIAQSAGTGNQNGGNIVLTPGALSGSGSAGVADLSGPTGTGLKLPATPGNADSQTLDCYAETDVSSGYTLSGVTTTSGAITVAIRATRIGRTMTFAVSIAPAGGASLTFAAAWYLTMTGVSAPAFAGSLAVSSNDATVTRGTAWVNAVAGPTVYGSAAALGANVSLFLNGTI